MGIGPFWRRRKPLGTHLIVEMKGCPDDLLCDSELIEKAIHSAIRDGSLTLVRLSMHAFSPHGITAVALLAESHLSVHTWPELRYAAIDIFTCGDRARPRLACLSLVKALCPEDYSIQELRRGYL